ncbi:hypothetical protein F5884DRAFT_643019, partial [Xylogone sp. PMI_703]
SSPDPLHDSATYSSPPKRRLTRRSLALQNSSPKKQTFELDVGPELSPQKILVTVEAGESDMSSAGAASRTRASRRVERTTTTTVPVKGLSDAEDQNVDVEEEAPQKSKRRSRKSNGTPVPTKNAKRASTPPRRRKTFGDLVDGDDEEDWDFQMGQNAKPNGGRRRSRSKSKTPVPQNIDATDEAISTTTTKKGRGKKISLAPEDTDQTARDSPTVDPELEDTAAVLESVGINKANPPSPDFSTIRSSATIGGDEDVLLAVFDPSDKTPRTTGCMGSAGAASSSSDNTRGRPSPHGLYPEGEEEDIEAEDEVGELVEFDTILEGEGFSMISVDSVPSLREHWNSPAITIGEEWVAKIQNPTVLALQCAAGDDSFSSIPSEILEAATPARNPLISKLAHNQLGGDSFSSIPPEILDAATPAKPAAKFANSSARMEGIDKYDDSFSAIAPSISEGTKLSSSRNSITRSAAPSEQLTIPKQRRGGSQNQRSISNSSISRLLTPEDSPPLSAPLSPTAVGEAHNSSPAGPPPGPAEQTLQDSSILYPHIKSSPPLVAPRFTYSTHSQNQQQLYADTTETPSVMFSSPSLPPPIQPIRGQRVPSLRPDQIRRPALSPVARTGRVLQNIMTPLSSSQRSQNLGSPFGSPASGGRSLPIASNPTERNSQSSTELVNQATSAGFETSEQGISSELPQLGSCGQQRESFHSYAETEQRPPSPQESNVQRLNPPSANELANHNLAQSRASMMDEDEDEDGAMSWQSDDNIHMLHEHDIGNAEEPSLLAGNYPADNSGSNVKQSDGFQEYERRVAAERAAISRTIDEADPSNVIMIDSEDEQDYISDGEEFNGDATSLLLETLNSTEYQEEQPQESQFQNPSHDSVEKPRRSKIPSPWRKNSKRLVYSDELSQISHLSSPRDPNSNRPIILPASDEGLKNGLSSFNRISDKKGSGASNWHVPQKANFKPRVRESGDLDISALLGSPAQPLPVISQSTTPVDDRDPVFAINENNTSTHGGSKYPATSHDVEEYKTPVLQKQGFKPRVREAGNIEISQNFASSPPKPGERLSLLNRPAPSLAPLTTSSASRTNILQSQQGSSTSTGNSSPDHSIPENGLRNRTDVRAETPLEEAQGIDAPISPTKSCLRSPEKARTSSTDWMTPNKSVAFVSSSPYSSPVAEPLSSTTWSRAHWLLLDSIYQEQRPENQVDNNDNAKKRRNSTRVISNLLGKRLSAQGERIRLEQWHLEIIDEFRGTVPGWEEVVIAKRLFAIIVGEKQRAAGYS